MLHEADADEIGERFALGRAPCLVGPMASGHVGEIWQLTTDRGRFAVKVSARPGAVAGTDRDAAYQDAVRAAGVPLPAVIRATDGAAAVSLRDAAVRVHEWVDVLPVDRMLDPAAVGRLVAGIHAVAMAADEPPDEWYVAGLGTAVWGDLVARLRDAGAPFADPLAALVPDVLAAESLLVAPTDVQLCHRDLFADNVRRTQAGGLVVLDWEDSGPGSPTQELGVVLFEFGCGDPGRMRRLHTAYVEAGGPGRLERPADLTMLIAQTGHIARAGCEQWLAARTDDEREAHAAWVAEFLDEPVTRRTVDAILAAVRP